jgi:hypothetical protein
MPYVTCQLYMRISCGIIIIYGMFVGPSAHDGV